MWHGERLIITWSCQVRPSWVFINYNEKTPASKKRTGKLALGPVKEDLVASSSSTITKETPTPMEKALTNSKEWIGRRLGTPIKTFGHLDHW